MADPVRFLTALGKALSAQALYDRNHPARERAVEHAFQALLDLREADATPRITFLEGEVYYDQQVIQALKGWDWAARLSLAGIQRIEVHDPVALEDFRGFLEELAARVSSSEAETAEARQMVTRSIRYGMVGIRGSASPLVDAVATAGATFAFSLGEEVRAVQWVHEEVASTGKLPMVEAESIVRSLAVAMHSQRQALLPLLELRQFDEYTTTHATNVSVLSMALAEQLGYAPREVRTVGVAGLLHDLGKVRVPKEILTKPGALSEDEVAAMRRHPAEGARIILERERDLDLSAVVAYEHHIRIDGGGYPDLTYARGAHYASQLVHVCDVYDALCTTRPYREAWEPERAMSYLEERVGLEFQAELVQAFGIMTRHATRQVMTIEDPFIPPEPLPA